jgi:hypothetical protein
LKPINIPQGLKPIEIMALCGTAEAVPFRNQRFSAASEGVPFRRLLTFSLRHN